jgi:chromatin remodeling complex protein RSC6
MAQPFLESMGTQLVTINETICHLKDQLNVLQKQLKTMEKTFHKEGTTLKKHAEKKEAKMCVSKKKRSGIATPSKVSSELCEFLNKTQGTEIARTEVTKSVVAYIKENCLQKNAEKKNVILPDDKLKSLLGLNDDDTLTYFSLQKYMNKHFLKSKTDPVVQEEASEQL